MVQAKRTGIIHLGPPGNTFWDGESKEFGKIRPEKEKEWGSRMGQRVSASTTAPPKRSGGPRREL